MTVQVTELDQDKLLSLANAITARQQAVEVFDFADRWFGPGVEKVEIETSSEYDDNNYYDRVNDVKAFDASGKAMQDAHDLLSGFPDDEEGIRDLLATPHLRALVVEAYDHAKREAKRAKEHPHYRSAYYLDTIALSVEDWWVKHGNEDFFEQQRSDDQCDLPAEDREWTRGSLAAVVTGRVLLVENADPTVDLAAKLLA